MARKKSQSNKALQEELQKSGDIPSHIAIIMDGNGRWAKKRGLPRVAGHRRGVETVREIVEVCAELGVKFLTLYTFSTENWKRPKDEVSTLMRLLLKSLKERLDELNKNNIKLTCIGNIESLPNVVQKQLFEDIERTKNNTRMTLNLALSYSGRWELLEAIREISKKVSRGEISPESIVEQTISDHLTTRNMPEPELIIRTSGEFRVSNFLLWQIAYSEFVILDVFWPDFSREHLYDAIRQYQKRERRFGKVSEQIKSTDQKKEELTDVS